MKRQLIPAAIAIAIAVGGLSAAGSASAQISTESPEFGQHVAHCARQMGFDGTHNPGMHQGAAGWDGSECGH